MINENKMIKKLIERIDELIALHKSKYVIQEK